MLGSRVALATLFLVVALLPSCSTANSVEIRAAGLIAYTRIQGETYVLLADHTEPGRGWGAFGGWREEGESTAQAAAREFREETRCVYDSPSAEDLLEAPHVSRDRYLSYVVEVPYAPAQVFRSRPVPPECRGPSFSERGPWVWIPLHELRRCLAAGEATDSYSLSPEFVPEGSTTRLWNASASILLLAIEKGYLR